MYASPFEKRSSNVLYTAPQDDAEVASGNPSNTKDNFIHKFGAKVPARLILYFLSCTGFLVSFMMRNDMNFALVAMTRRSTDPLTNATMLENSTINGNDNLTLYENGSRENYTSDVLTRSPTELSQLTARCDTFDWSGIVQSIITSSFYWCYVLSQVAGGIATQYFGTKKVFGWSQFVTAVCSLLIPVAADLHYAAVIALRSIQGFASGLTWPAMYAVVGFWIPLAERSRFMSSFQGFSIGIGLTYPLCGFLIDNFGWRHVFYTTGTLGLLWCIPWYFMAFNTPAEHPRITPQELEYIEVNISAEIKDSLDIKVPWKSIFTSKPAWAIAITTFGRIWIHYVFIVGGPNFMQNVLKFDYKVNGFLSGMPFICSYISSVFFCYIADEMMLRRWISLTNIRKLFTALSQLIPGLLIYAIGYTDQITLLLVIWFIAVSFITASYAGAMANIVDIAPNLAGPVLAFCQTIHMSASFLSPLASGIIVTNPNSMEQWRTVFGVASVVTIVTYVVFQIYGTADIQKWNFVQRNDNSSEESEILKKQNEEVEVNSKSH